MQYRSNKARRGGEGSRNKLLFPCSAHPGKQAARTAFRRRSHGETTTQQQLPRLTAGVFAGMVGGISNAEKTPSEPGGPWPQHFKSSNDDDGNNKYGV